MISGWDGAGGDCLVRGFLGGAMGAAAARPERGSSSARSAFSFRRRARTSSRTRSGQR